MFWPEKVLLREVGPRDGLQNIKELFPTEKKIKLIKNLARAGIKAIEATSFVHPQAIPQLSDAERVLDGLGDIWSQVTLSALVGNVKGMQRAIRTPIREVVVVVSASEAHNRANLKLPVSRSLDLLKEISTLARNSGIALRGAVGTAFGCYYQGPISLREIRRVVDGMLAADTREITLADTAGLATPRQVYNLVTELKELYPEVTWALHVHDRYGLGLANCVAGLAAGVSALEGSVRGLGGCPFIPDAAGNVATENLVYMLQQASVHTGIKMTELCSCSHWLRAELQEKVPVTICDS